jgi:hypothetical protein
MRQCDPCIAARRRAVPEVAGLGSERNECLGHYGRRAGGAPKVGQRHPGTRFGSSASPQASFTPGQERVL